MPQPLTPFDSSPFAPGRIVFPGSPWPNGHAIVAFRWSARIEEASGLWFDLHLESDDYDAEDQDQPEEAEEDDSLPNWKSRGVWLNYHSCILSSTIWDHGGFRVTSDETPFAFDSLSGREFVVDPPPVCVDDPHTFGIYLQGHDETADHRITLMRLDGKNRWSIAWRGRVALVYLGRRASIQPPGGLSFLHEYKAFEETAFEGIAMPMGLTKGHAEEVLARFVAGPDQFRPEKIDGQWHFNLI